VPVLQRLRKADPTLKITVLTKAFFKPILETLPGINVIIADVNGKHKGVPGLWKLAGEIEAQKIDAIADFHNVLRSKILRFFLPCRQAGFSSLGIKCAAIDKGRAEKKALTRQNKQLEQLKTTHQRYADVLKILGFPIDWKAKIDLKKQGLPKPIENELKRDKKWIGIAPFAAHAAKMYPLDLMEKLLQKLDKNPNFQLLLFGGGKKENLQIEQLSKKYKNVICVAGRISFEDEIALISHLDAMLSMDSGNGHLAAMFEVPVITLWGATHPFAGFAPFQQPEENQLSPNLKNYPLLPTSVYGNKEVAGYENVMRDILPEQILQRIEEVLG